MRIALFIVVLIHSLIHLLGFLKAFKLQSMEALSLPIGKPIGLLWLLAAVLLLFYAFLNLKENQNAWWVGALGLVLSQVLILGYWKEARFGSIPNLLILITVIFGYGKFAFTQLTAKETEGILSRVSHVPPTILTTEEIKNLPAPVQQWLTQCGAVGKPKPQYGKIEQKAWMKLKPDQQNWSEAKALQYTTLEPPAFIWTVDVSMNGLMGFTGRDKWVDGKGAMLIKINSLFGVVDEKGPKINEGALQRYLGEMVWFPALALSPYVQWEAMDARTAKATMHYQGTSGSGTFYFKENGAFEKFTALRYKDNVPEAQRHEWVLTVDAYQTFNGITIPSKMKATWKLDQQDWTWLDLEITALEYFTTPE